MRADALRAYFGMMGDWQVAQENAADQGKSLPDHAEGQALHLISDDVAQLRRDGDVGKGRFRIAPQVTETDPTSKSAIVSDCADTTDWLTYKAADGSPVGVGAGGKHRITAHLVEDANVWRVDQLSIKGVGSC